MRIIFIYFWTIYILINFVASLEDTPVNNRKLDKFEYSNYFDFHFNGKNNPDIDLNTYQLIAKYGYPSEVHIVITEDDYLLTLHRIPGKPNSHPVLLQHGLLASSADWVISGPKKALAYLLADDGYDVWLGNFRGNTYSRAHKNFSTNDAKFWDFSFHEMGIYDLPAMISYITNLKKSNLTYIGHSMGTTAFYVMSTLRVDITSRVQMMFNLAPAIYFGHMKSPARFLAPFSNNLQFLAHLLGQNEFFPQSSILKFFVKYSCDLSSLGATVCSNVLFLITGFDKAQMNNTLLPVILSHVPAGTSTKTFIHLLQGVKSANFRQFDYGAKRNLQIYNNITPPEYNISTITVPMALYYAPNDWLVNVKDVLNLSKELRNVVDKYKIPFEKFNHLDFLWAIDARKLVYNRILHTMKGE
ncbi:PREDICTED: lipase 3-like [Polistes canadensis]|uniref:lipase 3-like n=1 Tax=Polistes canadensis TaxID=91411 RepID=UPI000718C2CB|nr:PREDICTED: lipase 3-like [Polistes canadensis]